MINIFTLLCLLCSFTVWADGPARLLEAPEKGIAKISHPATALWKNGDFLCLYRAEKTIACGVVTSANNVSATLALDFTNEPLEPGDRVDKAKPGKKTAGVPIVESENVHLRSGSGASIFLRTALLWDVNQWFLSTSAEFAVSNHVAYGVKADLFDVFRVNPKLTGKGVLLTRTFFTLPHFSGIGAQLGMGTYFFTGNDGVLTGNGVSFVAELNVSCRITLLRWLTMGFQSGLRYISTPNLQGVDVGKFHPLRGAIGIDLALRF